MGDALDTAAVVALSVSQLGIYAGSQCLLEGLDLTVRDRSLTAIVGPSGSGKSSFLRSLNRLSEDSDGLRVTGHRELFGHDLLSLDVNMLRQQVGMVFQKPCVFPGSIHKNVIFGLRHLGLCRRRDEPQLVKRELERVGLWDEVKGRLQDSAQKLSVGQQQRLCLARALTLKPKILLLDEPTSALDPASAQRIENLLSSLTTDCAVILVTHSLNQARRLADQLLFLSMGRVVECGPTEELFLRAKDEQTKAFLRFKEEAH